MKGYIKSYSEKKGYGFIDTDNDGVVFVHKSGVKKFGHFGLQKGDQVSFELKETHKGIQAVKVQSLD